MKCPKCNMEIFERHVSIEVDDLITVTVSCNKCFTTFEFDIEADELYEV